MQLTILKSAYLVRYSAVILKLELKHSEQRCMFSIDTSELTANDINLTRVLLFYIAP